MDDRMVDIKQKIYAHGNVSPSVIDAFPPSRVNAAPYMALKDVVQVGSLHIPAACEDHLREHLDPSDNAGFSIRDILIIEQLMTLTLHAANMMDAALTTMNETLSDRSDEAVMAREVMAETCQMANDDVRKATIEMLWHLVTTRRLQSFREGKNAQERETFLRVLRRRLTSFSALF